MRVLLVYWNPSRELVPAAPVGLAYVATATRQAGHEVSFLDLTGRPCPLDDLRARLGAVDPGVVGVSVRNIDNVVRQRPTWHLESAAQLVAAIRAASRATIVLGGPAVSILGGTVLRHLDADYAVVGEGEETFPRLLADLEEGRLGDGLPGVCRRGDTAPAPPAAPRLPRFAASGLEHWIDWRPYRRACATWPIQTRRGCALGCTYCAYPLIEGRVPRERPPAEVVDEIDRVLATAAPPTIEFVDSTFNVPSRHAEALCEELVRRRPRASFTAMGVNPLGVSDRLFGLMRQAGFNSMMVTPEAASEAMLRSLRKGFGVDEVRRTAALARESGMASLWFFMLGGPGETAATVEETVSFVERYLDWHGCVALFMTGIRVLPGTELAQTAVRDGLVAPGDDLVQPRFYMAPGLDEDWVLARINRAMARCPGIVHAAEEGTSALEHVVDRTLRGLGVAPPHWRFLPHILRFPPVPALRRRHPPAITPGGSPGGGVSR